MRFLLSLSLLAGCFLLGACGTTFKQENDTFFSSAYIYPGELHFNEPVPGFVHSPYAPDAGLVDVRGFKPGTYVRCPYTGRLFVVPPYSTHRVEML